VNNRYRALGLIGIIISVLSFMLTVYLFLKSAVTISLTRDIAGETIATSNIQSMMQWIDTLGSSWIHSLIPIPILATILLLYSLLLLSIEPRRS